jgi:hypothetical protein
MAAVTMFRNHSKDPAIITSNLKDLWLRTVRDGRELLPMFVLVHKSGNARAIITPFQGSDDKESVAQVITEYVTSQSRTQDPVEVVAFAAEAWSVTARPVPGVDSLEQVSKEVDLSGGSLANHPEREEIFLVRVETATGQRHTHWPIVRNPDKPPSLGEAHNYTDTDTNDGGRFSHLLRPRLDRKVN